MSNKYSFDKNKYSPQLLEIFEVLSSYFVDIYYNHLYLEAKKEKINNNVETITEGYKHSLNAFLESLHNEKFYKKYLIDLYEYFKETELIKNTSFNQFTNTVTDLFIPKQFLSSIDSVQKTKFLKNIILQSNKKFIEILVKNYFCSIIDDHNNLDNVRELQDRFNEILIIEKETMYNRFITSQTKTNVKTPQVNNMVLNKMMNEITKLHKDNYDLKKKIIDLKKLIIIQHKKYIKIIDINKSLENKISDMKTSELKSNIVMDNYSNFEPNHTINQETQLEPEPEPKSDAEDDMIHSNLVEYNQEEDLNKNSNNIERLIYMDSDWSE